jgi:hypothetical protein
MGDARAGVKAAAAPCGTISAAMVRALLLFVLVPVLVALVTSALSTAAPLAAVLRRSSRGPALRFGVDTPAFRNDSRIHHKGKPDLYANWCFVLARAVTQFQRFARFDPEAPRVAAAEYVRLVREVTRRSPWRAPLHPEDRIVIPGFASFHALTRDEEAAVKAGLRGRLWTLLHPTNWRIVYPHVRSHQQRVAAETVSELQEGRPVQLFITDFPGLGLDHSVLVFDYRVRGGDAVDLIVYDPNDPGTPGCIRFDRDTSWFRPAPLCGVASSHLRAFRMYCSPLI